MAETLSPIEVLCSPRDFRGSRMSLFGWKASAKIRYDALQTIPEPVERCMHHRPLKFTCNVGDISKHPQVSHEFKLSHHFQLKNCFPFFSYPLYFKVGNNSLTMASRISTGQLCRSISQASSHRLALPHIAAQRRYLATTVHPVTQDATGSKGPTAMVFLNMGGPSTTDEVGSFLSRLFVGYHQR